MPFIAIVILFANLFFLQDLALYAQPTPDSAEKFKVEAASRIFENYKKNECSQLIANGALFRFRFRLYRDGHVSQIIQIKNDLNSTKTNKVNSKSLKKVEQLIRSAILKSQPFSDPNPKDSYYKYVNAEYLFEPGTGKPGEVIITCPGDKALK